MSRRGSGRWDSCSRDRGATRRPHPAAAGRPRHRRNLEGGAEPRRWRVSRRSVRERRCDRAASRSPRAAFVATAPEVKSALSEQPRRVRGSLALRPNRGPVSRASTQPEEVIWLPHDCGLPAPWFGLPRRRGMVRSGVSPGLVCGLFRMSGALMSGPHAQSCLRVGPDALSLEAMDTVRMGARSELR